MPIEEFAENPAYADRPVWREVWRGPCWGFHHTPDHRCCMHGVTP